MLAFVKNTLGVWLVLVIIFFPFPYDLFPQWITIASDSVLLYQISFWLLPIAIILTGFFHVTSVLDENKLFSLTHVLIAYFLAFYLFEYGANKLLKHQFYIPDPNILHTPVGYLTKDILFWSSMGSSYMYNVFMGVIEIIPAILLLSKRTRMLGAFISLGVLLNVWVINLSFDITVKLLSGSLFLCSVFLLLPYLPKLLSVFLEFKVDKQSKWEALFEKNSSKKRIIKGSIIAIMLFEVLLPYFQRNNFNGDQFVVSDWIGSYELVDENNNSFDGLNVKRLHIHRLGYLILEDRNSNFFDHRITSSEALKKINLIDLGLALKVHNDHNVYTFSWNREKKNHQLKMRKIDLNKLPLLDNTFHWTLESFVSSN